MRTFSRFPMLAAIATCGWASLASATVNVTADNQVSPIIQSSFTPTYLPSTTDLLTGLLPSASTGNFAQESATGLSALTDGLYPTLNTGVTGAHPGLATAGNTGGTTLTYTLPTPSRIDQLVIFGGWNDSGRDQQRFTVDLDTGSGFVPLVLSGANTTSGGVDFNPTIGGSLQSSTRITIADSGGSPLATGVTQIRFNFPSVENGYTGYAEIDAITAVPEPASLALFALGSISLLRRRRRA